MVITDNDVATQLLNFGLIYKKSKNLLYPPDGVISDTVFSHFLRGIFDGDGCIYVKSFNYKVHPFRYNNEGKGCTANFSVCSASKPFITSLRHQIKKYVQVEVRQHDNTKQVGAAQTFRLDISKREDVKKLYDFIYGNASYYLYRKKKKFDEFISTYYYPTGLIKNTPFEHPVK